MEEFAEINHPFPDSLISRAVEISDTSNVDELDAIVLAVQEEIECMCYYMNPKSYRNGWAALLINSEVNRQVDLISVPGIGKSIFLHAVGSHTCIMMMHNGIRAIGTAAELASISINEIDWDKVEAACQQRPTASFKVKPIEIFAPKVIRNEVHIKPSHRDQPWWAKFNKGNRRKR